MKKNTFIFFLKETRRWLRHHSPPIAPLGLSVENLGFAQAALQNLQSVS